MKKGHVPIRTCVACRTRRPKSEMVRLAGCGVELSVSPEGGRGLYLCPDASCLEKGLMRAGVTNTLGGPVYAEARRVSEKVASGENCLDGAHPGSVICDECHGGGFFG